ncbi:DUF2931 family protein [Pseudomonas sp. NFX98]|uniref:DUF2931 family protein n=1 Tax=Pseudomonas sp. NFX98 TaxID=3399122 RepID=UPI0039FCCD95
MALGNEKPTVSIIKSSRLIKRCTGLLFGLLLSGCAQSAAQSSNREEWFLGFGAPDYMEVWIETADVMDIHERLLRTAVAGVASVQTPRNNKGKPAGWPENPGSGAGHYIRQVGLPRLIYVRWQSLAEPQTYEAYIVIPESAREIMRKPEKAFCTADAKWITDYRDDIGIGLAPGGIAKVWLGGTCLNSVEIARVEGRINPKGPYGGKSGGKHRPLSEISKAYVEKFGIPYGSW